MFDSLKIENTHLYRGEVPFFLKNLNKNIVYLCSSKKNLNDYYYIINDFYKGNLIISEGNSEEDYIKFNYEIAEVLRKNESYIILLTLEFFVKEYIYIGNRIHLKKGNKINVKNFIEKLEENNYKRNYIIENRNEYSHRGDIIDFYPINGDYPIRIELFDNEIERINYFEIDTQKSLKINEEINMYIDSNKKSILNFLEIFKENKSPNLYCENIEVLEYKLKKILDENSKENEIIKERFVNGIKNFTEIKNKSFTNGELETYQNLNELKNSFNKTQIVICSEEEKRYKEMFQGYLNIEYIKYPLYEGFKNNGKIYLSDRELKGIRVKRDKKIKIVMKKSDLSQIKINDYIIHETFGVGIYKGLKIINNEEYLEIKYADEDKLYVSTSNLDKIEKFQAEPGNEPEVYKLGRKGFKKRREKLKADMLIFAKEIIEIQAKRALNKGFIFSKDSIWQEEFEDGFPYTLTKDQNKAIEEMKRDMESGKVMDRIVCGDVGCGKTEVALRGAFKAVCNEKQVAIMVPTTVLAQQHYERIIERLKNYPFNVELLSRLKSEKEQDECIKKIANGSVDIVIGTHKLISEKVKFKDLGLVIIDEEQKFGVKVKEKFKHLKNNVDMLTLTATPIPRTLNLALLGIRDISIIETLPNNRIPTEDFFIENTPELIREAIMKEFSREGQVYYIFNSVKKIEKKVEELSKILPSFIKISYIHGQMISKTIRDRLHGFENGDIDILVSTTIIENGIDVENANTIIIEGLDKLGLSQLYQLRGRIGRGSEKGYCYLIVNPNKDSKSKVKMREESMKSLSDMGSGTGFNLSLEDMRIRGAGEILGDKQHGALEVLGYGLYMKLLQEEIAKLKGEYIEPIEGFILKLEVPRYIPDYYIEKEEKISIYKRVALINKVEEIEELKEELEDRFGKAPKETLSYLRGEKIRILCRESKIQIVEERENECYFKFLNDSIVFEKIIELIQMGKAKYLKDEKALLYKGKIEEFIKFYNERIV